MSGKVSAGQGRASTPRGSVGGRAGRSRAPDDKRKLGEYVAAQIEKDIAALGWPVGVVLGSETDLMARYRVSRAVFREAVRLLEHHGVTDMRRGPGGGLTVRVPEVSSVARAAEIYLDYTKVTVAQLHEARLSLELASVELAVKHLDEDGIGQLREVLGREQEAIALESQGREHGYLHDRLHLEIARLSGNPVFPLYVSVLTQLAYQRSVPLVENPAANSALVLHAHSAIVEAIVAGDLGLARYRMQRHLEALAQWLEPAQ